MLRGTGSNNKSAGTYFFPYDRGTGLSAPSKRGHHNDQPGTGMERLRRHEDCDKDEEVLETMTMKGDDDDGIIICPGEDRTV